MRAKLDRPAREVERSARKSKSFPDFARMERRLRARIDAVAARDASANGKSDGDGLDRRRTGQTAGCARQSGGEALIRDFRATDQHTVKNLILHGLREHWGSLNTELNQALDDLLESHRKGRVLVVVVGSIVVGTGMVLPCGEGDAEIVRMSIVRKLPRSSLGGSLVERLTATAGSLACCAHHPGDLVRLVGGHRVLPAMWVRHHP